VDDQQVKRTVDAIKSMRRGEFSPNTGWQVDAQRRRLYITKNEQEVTIGFTAEEAITLLDSIKQIEAQLRQWADETRQERAHG
jgi:hypothetical protein